MGNLNHFQTLNFYRILLSELIGHLEGAKIENIQMNPKSQASCLQNLKKAL
jgi:hypothetical protein